MPEQADRYRAPALDKGLDILELLADQAEGLTRGEIVKAMGRSPSEIYRMLERLVARGYVSRHLGDRFALSMKLFVLSTRHPAWRRLVTRAQPLMDAFARDLQQSCHLVIPEGGQALVIAQASPIGTWEFRVKIGAQLNLLTSASGQTLLAFQTDDSLSDTLALWGACHLERDARSVMQAGAEIAAQGFRCAPSAQLFGVQDLSVPIRDPNGRAVAALTCAYIARPTPVAVPNQDLALAALQALALALE
jgi:DNA-binding IclR family transcriptional regulator